MKESEKKLEALLKIVTISLYLFVILLFVVLAGVYLNQKQNQKIINISSAKTYNEGEKIINKENNNSNKDNKLKVIEFSDFECPFCKRFYDESYSQLYKYYISTGKIEFEYRNFPLSFHKNAFNAALAYECAKEQNKGKLYHNKLFETNVLDLNSLKNYAVELNLNVKKFNDCLDSRKYEKKINQDLELGKKMGVSGTPTFFIGDKKVVGAQPFYIIKKEIEKQLKNKNK